MSLSDGQAWEKEYGVWDELNGQKKNEMLYLILTTRHRDQLFGGDVHLFWGRDSSGYSAILQRAGLYTKEQVDKKCDEGDIPIPYTYFGYNKEFFAQDTSYVQFPVLCSKSKEVKNMIADWQYEYRHKN